MNGRLRHRIMKRRVLWVLRGGPIEQARFTARFTDAPERFQAALHELVAEGRVTVEQAGGVLVVRRSR
jgi:hypothetical protein